MKTVYIWITKNDYKFKKTFNTDKGILNYAKFKKLKKNKVKAIVSVHYLNKIRSMKAASKYKQNSINTDPTKIIKQATNTAAAQKHKASMKGTNRALQVAAVGGATGLVAPVAGAAAGGGSGVIIGGLVAGTGAVLGGTGLAAIGTSITVTLGALAAFGVLSVPLLPIIGVLSFFIGGISYTIATVGMGMLIGLLGGSLVGAAMSGALVSVPFLTLTPLVSIIAGKKASVNHMKKMTYEALIKIAKSGLSWQLGYGARELLKPKKGSNITQNAKFVFNRMRGVLTDEEIQKKKLDPVVKNLLLSVPRPNLNSDEIKNVLNGKQIDPSIEVYAQYMTDSEESVQAALNAMKNELKSITVKHTHYDSYRKAKQKFIEKIKPNVVAQRSVFLREGVGLTSEDMDANERLAFQSMYVNEMISKICFILENQGKQI